MSAFVERFLPLVPIAGLVFQAGKQSEKLDELFNKTFALEADQKSTREVIFEIHGKVCSMEKELSTIEKELDSISKRI